MFKGKTIKTTMLDKKKLKEKLAFKIIGKKDFDNIDIELITRWGTYLILFIIEFVIGILIEHLLFIGDSFESIPW